MDIKEIHSAILNDIYGLTFPEINKEIINSIQNDEFGSELIKLWRRHDTLQANPPHEKNEKFYRKSINFLLSSLENIYQEMTLKKYDFVSEAKQDLKAAQNSYIESFGNDIYWKLDTTLAFCHSVLSYLVSSVYVTLQSEESSFENSSKDDVNKFENEKLATRRVYDDMSM